MISLKDHSEFEAIDGHRLKNIMAEQLVMNYSNVELQKILYPSSYKKGGGHSPIIQP